MRYRSLSSIYLTGWSLLFLPRLPKSLVVLLILLSLKLSYGLSTPLAGFPKAIPLAILNLKCSPNPDARTPGVWPLPVSFARRYPESMFLSLPPAT